MLAYKEMRSSNPAIKRMGVKRALGIGYGWTYLTSTVKFATYMAAKLMGAVMDEEDEEDKERVEFSPDDEQAELAAKQIISDFYRDTTVMPVDMTKLKGWMRFADVDHMQPLSLTMNPIKDLLFGSEGEEEIDFMQRAQKFALHMMKPYISQQMWLDSLNEASRKSQDITSNLEQYPISNWLGEAGKLLYRAGGVPGSFVDLADTYKAFQQGETRKGVRRNTPSQQVISNLTGVRMLEINVPEAVGQKFSFLMAQRSAIETDFNRWFSGYTTWEEGESEEMLERVQQQGYANMVAVRKVIAAARYFRGYNAPKEINEAGKRDIIPKDVWEQAEQGYYAPFTVPINTVDRMLKRAGDDKAILKRLKVLKKMVESSTDSEGRTRVRRLPDISDILRHPDDSILNEGRVGEVDNPFKDPWKTE